MTHRSRFATRFATNALRWTAGLLAVLVAGCGERNPEHGRPAVTAGQQLYRNYCLSCHQADGGGVPGMYPPLIDSEWVQGDKGRLVRLLLNGMRGPIEVKGETYDNIMTPHGHLSDQDLAAVLTFVRSGFDNDASPVTPEEVAAVRAANTQRGLWQASELEQATGIPGM